MDFLRKFFGFESPRDQPTFPENGSRNQRNEGNIYIPPFVFSFSNEPNLEFGQSPSVHNDSSYQEYGFMDPFQQVEQMMDMLQRAMSDFDFKQPGDYPSLMPPPPDSPDTSQNLSPRDRFLKTPDSHLPAAQRPEDDNFTADPGNSSVVRRPQQFHPDSPYHNHSWNPGFGFGSIFRMMDELMKPFATDDFLRPSDNLPDGAELHPHAPREALLKQDQDLDQRPPQDLQQLLKEGPGYSAGRLQQQQPPVIRSNFTSTSISRTVRPDGVIEERRTYRDSSGREEVTVTEMDPATTHSLVPNPFGGDGGGLHSFFGKFF